MKTHGDELNEMTDLVIKLTWTQTVFAALFDKRDTDAKVRKEHPELFLTFYEALFCSFCVAVEILFEQKEKATSLWALVQKAKPTIADKLEKEIQTHASSVRKFESIRHQACAHRWQAKRPQDVFEEVKPSLRAMREVTELARFVILELVGEVDKNKRSELERQQLSDSTLRCVTDDSRRIIQSQVAPTK